MLLSSQNLSECSSSRDREGSTNQGFCYFDDCCWQELLKDENEETVGLLEVAVLGQILFCLEDKGIFWPLEELKHNWFEDNGASSDLLIDILVILNFGDMWLYLRKYEISNLMHIGILLGLLNGDNLILSFVVIDLHDVKVYLHWRVFFLCTWTCRQSFLLFCWRACTQESLFCLFCWELNLTRSTTDWSGYYVCIVLNYYQKS